MTRFHLPQRSASYCAILTLACASALCARELRLDTATDVTLLLPARPASASRFAPNPTVFTTDVDLEEALEDLREGLLRRCGARATVRSEIPTTPGVVVHIGRTALAESLVPDLDALDLEGFVLRTEGSNLLLAGRTPLGTRHAIYTFLERHCGIRWFFPHPLGTLVPETSPLVLPEFDERHQPAFLSRYFTLHRQPGKETWERRNKVQNHWSNRLKGNSHAMAAIFPAGTFAAEHPEVYALVQGKRRLPGGNVPEARAAYCLSNPEVADRCIAWLLAYFAKHPQAASVSMAMNDTSVTCDCADCRSRGVDGTTDGPTYSDRYFAFVNEVARRIRPDLPDKVIGVLGYGPTRTVPARLPRLEENINVYLVTGATGNLDPSYRERRRDLLDQWKDFAASLCLYSYQFGSADNRFYQVPAFYPRLVQEELQHLRACGVRGYCVEMLPVWTFSPRPWLLARWLWDPAAPYDALMEEFCALFGGGGHAMRRYFDLLEQAWMQQDPRRSTSGRDSQYDLYRPHFGDLEALLDGARAGAGAGAALDRVVFYADGLRLVRLFADSAQIAGEFTPYPATAEELLATLDGTRRLLANELALKAQRERLDQAYGIAPAVIAPRDKTAVLRTALAQCARWIEQHGLAEEAARLRADPAATFGQDGTPPETNGIGDAIDEALARATEIRTAAAPMPAAAPRDPVRHVDRSSAAQASGARLLLRETFDDDATIAGSGGRVYGTARFEPGVQGQGLFLGSQDAMVDYPIEKLNPMAGTLELFMNTRWAGRDEEVRAYLVCTGGNQSPPGHLSLRLAGEPGRRRVYFALYTQTANLSVFHPLPPGSDSRWQHLAAMWSIDPERPENNRAELFLNGKRAQAAEDALRAAGRVEPTAPLAFGNRPVGHRFQALPLFALDEVRLYDRPIPPETFSFAPVVTSSP